MGHADSLKRVHERIRDRQDYPTFVWFGQEVPCTATTFTRRTLLTIGGLELEADMTIRVSKCHFLVASSQEVTTVASVPISDNRPWPKAGMKYDYCGRRFRIEAVNDPMPNVPDTQLFLVGVSVTK